MLDENKKRTATIVVPSNTHLVQSDTFPRTEQRKWKEKVLPYMRGYTIITGEVYQQVWDRTQGTFQLGDPELSQKTWIVLYLQGPKSELTADHRMSIIANQMRAGLTIPPERLPQIITVPSARTMTVMIEAGGPNWSRNVPNDIWQSIVMLPGFQDVAKYPGGYATRFDSVRWELNLPQLEAKALTKLINNPDARAQFEQDGLEVFSWVEEDVHSTEAVSFFVLTKGKTEVPGRHAMEFMSIMSKATQKDLVVAPGKYYEVREYKRFPYRRYSR